MFVFGRLRENLLIKELCSTDLLVGFAFLLLSLAQDLAEQQS